MISELAFGTQTVSHKARNQLLQTPKILHGPPIFPTSSLSKQQIMLSPQCYKITLVMAACAILQPL